VGQVEVRDNCIWVAHIQNDPTLREAILALEAGSLIKLTVDGRVGDWVKLGNGAGGVPTNGVRPVGLTKKLWEEIYAGRRGELIAISAVANSND
jgi:hypothetical protein